MSRSRNLTARLGVTLIAALMVSVPAVTATAASPGVADGGVVASKVPPKFTPNIGNGAVQAIVQVGSRLVVGGSFTTVTPTAGTGAGTAVTRNYLFAFNATTGALDTGFKPAVNGEVDAIVPTADGSGVYVGGRFTSAGGISTRLAAFKLSTGARITTFNPSLNGPINDMALLGSRLLVAGTFTVVKSVAHGGLTSINASTGALDPYLSIQLTGHHNFGRVAGAAEGAVGATSIAVSPDHSRAIVDGNFINAADGTASYARDQIVNINLGASAATVDPNWNSNVYTQPCFSNSYDSYVRDIGWSPDGSYFVVSATGGYNGGSFEDCDTASRFNASSTGLTVKPLWIDYTGTDSVYSVAVTSSAVYIGGHYRWLNNPYGQDFAGKGAVPRPGIAALDPANGVPLAWNPGRNPRGIGAQVIYATAAGVWVGSDTDYIGASQYKRQKIAFFPFAGGSAATGDNTGDARTVFQAGGTSGTNTFTANTFDPTTGNGAPAAIQPSNGGGIDWSTVRGAFTLNGRIWYGTSGGQFFYRVWDGANNFGAAQLVDPYNDPYWDNVVNGSPPSGTTYRGTATSFYAELPNVTGMFYANRSIYYTLSGSGKLFSRSFSPDTTTSSVVNQATGGVISPQEITVSDPSKGGPVNFSSASGMFLANGSLWYATTDGALHSAPWNGSNVSGPGSVDANATGNWAAKAVFVSPVAPVQPQPPTASFTSSCTLLACNFDGTGSTAPGSTISSYAWTFGDGQGATGATTSHSYAAGGTFNVSLTVTNGLGATNTATHAVTVSSTQQAPIAFVGSSSAVGNATGLSVPVPNTVTAGNGLLLLATASVGGAFTAPAGWTQVDTQSSGTAITSTVWRKVAGGTDAGSAVPVSFGTSTAVHGSVQLLAYSGTNGSNPVATYTKKLTTGTASSTYTTPTVTVPGSGDVVVSYWTSKSSSVASWTAPSGQTTRSVANGSGGGRITSLVTDGGPTVTGTAGGLTATTNLDSGSTTLGSTFAAWTIVIGG